MNIAHVIPYLGRAQGGPVFGLASYSSGLAEAGCTVEVFSSPHVRDGAAIEFDPRVRLRLFSHARWGTFRRCPELTYALSQTRCDIIHSHGLWTDAHRSAAGQARRRKVPHVLAPCGMLAPGALAHHRWKKFPVRIWFQGRALRETACLHAKSDLEYGHVRKYGLSNPVAIIPNPITPPPANDPAGVSQWDAPPGNRFALYLGRLHPVKGIARLVDTWIRLKKENSQAAAWTLVIAGPDETAMRPELEEALRASGCANSVIFAGELNESQKWAAYKAADLFVMPSDFENFGSAVAEALFAGLPVIATAGTPWKDLPARSAGWCVPATADALYGALTEATAMHPSALKEMGRRGLDLAAQFTPQKVALELMALYEWLLGRGPRPDCVKS